MGKILPIVVILAVLVGGFFLLRKQDMAKETQNVNGIEVTPISHATMVLNLAGKIIYTDPEGGAKAFTSMPDPDLILLTDIHPDHLDPTTLGEVTKEKTVTIM